MKSFFILLLAAVCFTSPSIKAETGSLANDHIFGNAAQFWRVSSAPSATVQATATKAAVVGSRHVIDCITATVAAAGTVQTPIAINFKDGTTAETLAVVSAPANSQGGLHACELKLAGSKGNSVTVEFSSGGQAAVLESVHISGYDLKQ